MALNAKGAPSSNSAVAFLFTCADPALEASIAVPLSYQLTHLHNDITAVKGIEGYKQSSWIAFTTGPFEFHIGPGPLQFPTPLRELPLPPTALAQSGLGSAPANPTPSELSQWDYGFTYTSRRAAQDSLLAAVSFNEKVVPAPPANDPSAGLFTALAQLIACTPAIFADFNAYFNAYLSQVGPDTATASSAFLNAQAAMTAWKALVSGFATAYANWVNPPHQSACMSLATRYVRSLGLSVRFFRFLNRPLMAAIADR